MFFIFVYRVQGAVWDDKNKGIDIAQERSAQIKKGDFFDEGAPQAACKSVKPACRKKTKTFLQ